MNIFKAYALTWLNLFFVLINVPFAMQGKWLNTFALGVCAASAFYQYLLERDEQIRRKRG